MADNPNAPGQCQVIGRLQRGYVSSDWDRYTDIKI